MTDRRIFDFEQLYELSGKEIVFIEGNKPNCTAIDAIISFHETKSEPHPQYIKESGLKQALANHKAEPDPHPQYTTSTNFTALANRVNQIESGITPTPPSKLIQVTTSSITITQHLIPISSSEAITLSAKPSLNTNVSDGTTVRLLNVGNFPITLQDETLIADTKLYLGSSNTVLYPKRFLTLTFFQGFWYSELNAATVI